MKILKDDFLLGGADVGVDLRGGEGAVAEDGLDVFDVHTFFQKEGCKGVAEGVGCYGLEDTGFQSQFFYHDSYRLGGQVASQTVDEEECALSGRKAKPLIFPESLQNCVLAYLDNSFFASFSVYFDEAVMEVYGFKAQRA